MNELTRLGCFAQENGIDLSKSAINFDGYCDGSKRQAIEEEMGWEKETISPDCITITIWHKTDVASHKNFRAIKRVFGTFEREDDSSELYSPLRILPGNEGQTEKHSQRVMKVVWYGGYECTVTQTRNCVFKGFDEETFEDENQ